MARSSRTNAFYFFSGENFTQHVDAPVNLAGTTLTGVSSANPYFTSPYKELELLVRFDFNLPNGYKAFIPCAYHHNSDVAGFGGSNNYSPYNNEDNTPNVGAGLDFLTGNFSHSFRLGYFRLSTTLPMPLQGARSMTRWQHRALSPIL